LDEAAPEEAGLDAARLLTSLPLTPGLVDPFGGVGDVRHRVLRAVGDPDKRFGEDALRMIRAIRFATTLDFEIEARTLDAIQRHAPLVQHLSGERIAAELDRILAAPQPSVGLRLMADTGILEHISQELTAQRGVGQNKIAGEDLWDHTLRTVDAAPPTRPIVRLAALVHDMGKPPTAADGHFYGHERVGAELAEAFLSSLRYPRAVVERVTGLVRQHMFAYEPSWTDTAVRRFIAKVGAEALPDLFELRRADNVGSGREAAAEGLDELRRRVDEQLEADVALDRSGLAVDGDDLIAELGLEQGPQIGRVLEGLVEQVIADPSLNDRPTLLLLARNVAEGRS
jgi:tRNA nucleotidyltransferase/poly(A) polymerase